MYIIIEVTKVKTTCKPVFLKIILWPRLIFKTPFNSDVKGSTPIQNRPFCGKEDNLWSQPHNETVKEYVCAFAMGLYGEEPKKNAVRF